MSTQLPRGADALTDTGEELAPEAEKLTEHGIPAFMAGDIHTRAWLQVFEHGSLYRGWHPADVEWALGAAHQLLRRLGGRVGPGGAKGYWPVMLQEEGQQPARRRIAPSEVSGMQAAMGWAWAHLGAHEPERRAVQRWAFCREMGLNHTRFLREAGVPRATETRRWRRGFTIIAAALCRTEVRIPREVLVARLERATSDVRGEAPDGMAVAAQAGDLPPTGPMPVLYAIDGMWRDVELCGLLAPEAQAAAVLMLLHDRARLEAACGAIANSGPSLNARVAQLRAEALGRGLLAADARQAGTLTRSDLTARIERNRETSE